MNTILYILGYGRSGSSILSWLLNSHPNILSVGELFRLPNAIKTGPIPKYCSCGLKLTECQFWNNIFKKANDFDLSDISFDEWNSFLFKHLYKNNPGTTTIVDSSCRLQRLRQLKNSCINEHYQLKVIFLSRDARGVIFSVSKKGYNLGQWKQPLLRAIISWYIRNVQYINIFKKYDPENIIHIKHEDLVSDPQNTLMSIYKFIGENPQSLNKNWKNVPPHTFAGNLRLRQSKSDTITPDEKWRKGFSKRELFLINCITGRLNRKLLNGLNK